MTARKFTILLILATFYPFIQVHAQLLKSLQDKVKEKAGTALSGNTEAAAINLAITTLQKAHAKRDSTAMSLALSSYDNVSFYSDRKGASLVLRGATVLLSEINDYEFDPNTNLLGGKKKNTSYSNLSSDEYQTLKKAETLNQNGEISYSSRYFEFAEKSFLAAQLNLMGSENLEKSLLNAKIKSNLGMLHHSMGAFDKASEEFEKAFDVLEQLGSSGKYLNAVALNNQSILLKDLGHFNEAEQKQKESIALLEGFDSNGGALAIAQNNLAILYQYLGRLDESIQLLENIVSNNEANWNEKSNTYQRININLALIYENAGQFDKAEKIYLDALKLKERQNRVRQPDYASILTNLSSLYINTGQLDKNIEQNLEKAESIYTKSYNAEHPTVYSVLKVKGLYQLSSGKSIDGLKTLKRNQELATKIYGYGHPKVNESRVFVAYAKWLNNDVAGAKKDFISSLDENIKYIQTYFPAMSEVEKSKYWQTLQSDFQTFYAFVVDQPAQELIEKLIEYEVVVKGLLLSTSGKIRRQILASKNRNLIKKYEDWKSSKTLLAYCYTLTEEELKEQKINIDSIARASNSQERWLSANSDVFSTGKSAKITYSQLSSKLKPEEAMVDVIKYFDPKSQSDQYAAVIMRPNGADIIKIGSEEDLDQKAIKLYKNSVIYKQSESKSYFTFWNPIETKLGGAKKIFMIKDGVYNQVSIGSLYDGGTYLTDHYDISVLTNPQELLNIEDGNKSIANIFLMGSPAFDHDQYAPLPGTAEEVNSIATLAKQKGIPVDKYLETQASELNFEKSSDYTVLHVATHGFFVDKKQENKKVSGQKVISSNALDALMRSGLVLADEAKSENSDLDLVSDGLATAYEISSLDFPETEIVILSACETGLGEIQTGEGVYGLQRSFLVAGANSVIMSLWKVDDSATRDFMISFYQQWLNTGDKHGAFNHAKRQIKSKYPEPYYWGAFVLIEG